MRGRGASGLLGFLLLLLIAAPAYAQTPADTDKRTVFCLGGETRAKLAEAAVSLKLATSPQNARLLVGGRQLTLEEWRDAKPKDFQRTCAAVAAGHPDQRTAEPASFLATMLGVLLPVVVGGLLTLFSTEWRVSANTGGKHADDLREAAFSFGEAVRDYAEDRRRNRPPSVTPFETAHANLARQLRRVRDYRPTWVLPGVLLSTLTEHLTRDGIDTRLATAEDEVDALLTATHRIGAALRRPWLPHPGMNADPAKAIRR